MRLKSYQFIFSPSLKKDFKRYKNKKNIIETLFQLVGLLAEDKQIPEEYYPRSLKGNWNDYMECHIENDTLLIWYDKENNIIELVRIGSHSELFGKGRKKNRISINKNTERYFSLFLFIDIFFAPASIDTIFLLIFIVSYLDLLQISEILCLDLLQISEILCLDLLQINV